MNNVFSLKPGVRWLVQMPVFVATATVPMAQFDFEGSRFSSLAVKDE